VYLQYHAGVWGAHKSAIATNNAMKAHLWWETMTADVNKWVDRCLTCLRFRKSARRATGIPVKPTRCECWEDVMVDMEGPSNPPSAAGNRYVLTYMRCLSSTPLFEPVKRLTAAEVRRAFSRCMFRAGTLAVVLRTDRGPEFKNAILAEYAALVGIRRKFGTPWRPMEQGKVERVHQEAQKALGILMHDVIRAHGTEWDELLPVMEFLLYNTPGPHGFTPRDLDRKWSTSLPIAKELQPFQVGEYESLTTYAQGLFRSYRQVRAAIVKHNALASLKRTDLANRFRRPKELRPGMRVVYRDPRQRRAGGRAPWREPYSEPYSIVDVEASGNK
jgi:hypothetical protein